MLNVKRRRDFRERRWQFIAVAVTITLGVMMFAASYDAYLNLESSYQGTYDRLGFADMTVTGAERSSPPTRLDRRRRRRRDPSPGRSPLPDSTGDAQRARHRNAGRRSAADQPDRRHFGLVPRSGPTDRGRRRVPLRRDHDLTPGDTVEIFTGADWMEARGARDRGLGRVPMAGQEPSGSVQRTRDFRRDLRRRGPARTPPGKRRGRPDLLLYDEDADRRRYGCRGVRPPPTPRVPPTSRLRRTSRRTPRCSSTSTGFSSSPSPSRRFS